MTLIDSHCHLVYDGLSERQGEVLAAARARGVTGFLNISTRQKEWDAVVAVAEREPDVWASVGVHPHEADAHPDLGAHALVSASRHPRVIAIGECGLDYYYDKSDRAAQRERFQAHIEAARETGLPLVVHTRDAEEVDSADDLEGPAANALLKMLEEPPANTLFFLVAHAPGKLLPTIRSRCRRLGFDALGDDAMAALLGQMIPGADCSEVIALAGGSPGRAMQLKSLDLAPLLNDARAMMAQGDPDNLRRARLAAALGGKAQAERYAAFLDLAPGLVAAEARTATGARRNRMLDAYAKVRETVALAPRLSLDAAATAFALGGLFASIADLPASLKR